MSASPPKADMLSVGIEVRFVPTADISGLQTSVEKKKPRRGGRGFFGFLWGNNDGEGNPISAIPNTAVAVATIKNRQFSGLFDAARFQNRDVSATWPL